ncbi:MAG: vWA domain-containing protein [Planctomycetota bacterium]|jgi:hypothetical protein
MALRKLSTEDLEETTFRQTLLAFESMSGVDLTLLFGNYEMSATDGINIFVRDAFPDLGVDYLSYYSYVSFQHELAHILFKSDVDAFDAFVKKHASENTARAVFNIAEDERVETLWNQIYLTPFREMFVKVRTWRLQEKKAGEKLNIFDIMFDVRGQIKRSTDEEYLRLWEEVDEILEEVRGNVYFASTERAAEKLYELVLNNPEPETEAEHDLGNCDEGELNKRTREAEKSSGGSQSEDEESEEKDPEEAAKDFLDSLGFEDEDGDAGETNEGDSETDEDVEDEAEEEDNFDGEIDIEGDAEEGDSPTGEGGKGSGAGEDEKKNIDELEEDLDLLDKLDEMVDEIEEIDPSITKHNEVHSDLREVDEDKERENTQSFMDALKETSTPELDERTPEEILSIYSGLSKRKTKLPIVREEVVLPIKMKSKEWIDDEGEELDIEEYILKRVTNDRTIPIWKDERKEFGIDVSFVLDLSGSMGDFDCKVMFSAAWAIWNALEKMPKTNVNAIGYDRPGSVELMEDKEKMLFYRGGGSTASHTALEYAMLKLESASGARLIVHITDGVPDRADLVKEVMDKIRRKGIYVFTILVGRSGAAREIYGPDDTYVEVSSNVTELRDVIQDKLFPLVIKYLKLGA